MRTLRTFQIHETADGLIVSRLKTVIGEGPVGSTTEARDFRVADEDEAEQLIADMIAAEKPAMAAERERRAAKETADVVGKDIEEAQAK